MTILLVSILAFAAATGQLIRIPFAGGGITILDSAITLFCLVGLLRIKFHLRKPPVQIRAAVIFIFLAIASLAFTSLHLQLSEYITSFSYTIRFSLYILFAWLILSDAFGKLKENLEKALLLAGISLAIIGLLQFIFLPNLEALSLLGWDPHYFRTVSTFFDPNFAGAFFVLTLLLIIQDFKSDKKWNSVFFTLTYLALLTTFSRSSYAMFLVSGVVFSVLKKSIKLGFATIIFFAGLLIGFSIYSQSVAGPRNIDRTQSATFRFNTWQQGLELFQKSPILGIGFNAYRYGIKEYNLGNSEFLESHGSSSNDSSLLFAASTTGILGLGAYLYFLWTLFKSAYKEKNYIFAAGLGGLIIHSFFANSLFYPPILAWIVIISTNPKK